MPLSVKSITLWRKEVENQPGTLASTLEPFAKGGANLEVLMGYRLPAHENNAAIEIYPVAGRTIARAAQTAGLAASSIPTLLIEADNKPGAAYGIAQAVAEAGVNLAFFIAQAVGRRYSAVVGFETAEDAKKTAAILKRAARQKSRAAARKR